MTCQKDRSTDRRVAARVGADGAAPRGRNRLRRNRRNRSGRSVTSDICRVAEIAVSHRVIAPRSRATEPRHRVTAPRHRVTAPRPRAMVVRGVVDADAHHAPPTTSVLARPA